MTDPKSPKYLKNGKPYRNITIYGLISYYGTERAKKCANYLYKTLPRLYNKPTINVYYDYEWVEVVKKLVLQYGSKYRKLKYLKRPVIIFFNDKYIGDHRAIVHYVVMQHKILPDLPYPNLFPDFTDLLPRNQYKDYVYFDVRVGDLDDYVVGKMVFELHTDVVPKTCHYFKNLCRPFCDRLYGTNETMWKLSYLGSTIHRICGTSFIQGGRINGCCVKVKDENYSIKHCRRGVISICREGRNNSTTEFCISLKENQWLDDQVVAFGQLIFGEPILTAIQEVPEYYHRPLKDIIIVGCGIIPSYEERKNYRFRSMIEKQKEWINIDVEALRKKRIESIEVFEQKVKSFLGMSEAEKSVEYIFTENIKFNGEGDMFGLLQEEISGEFQEEEENEEEEVPSALLGERFKFEGGGEEEEGKGEVEEEQEEEGKGEEVGQKEGGKGEEQEEGGKEEEEEEQEERGKEEEEQQEEGGKEEEVEEKGEEGEIEEEEYLVLPKTGDFTLEEIMRKKRASNDLSLIDLMSKFIDSIVENIDFANSSDQAEPLDYIPKKIIRDEVDIREVPSDELLESRFRSGLYSVPESIRRLLVSSFERLTPSQLKLLGYESRELLKRAGIPEGTLSIVGSENIMSGLVMAVMDVADPKAARGSGGELQEVLGEICDDAVQVIKQAGPKVVRNMISNSAAELYADPDPEDLSSIS